MSVSKNGMNSKIDRLYEKNPDLKTAVEQIEKFEKGQPLSR